jgi:hypothetical protein
VVPRDRPSSDDHAVTVIQHRAIGPDPPFDANETRWAFSWRVADGAGRATNAQISGPWRRNRVNVGHAAPEEGYNSPMERDANAGGAVLRAGMPVEVSTRFCGDWVAGFEIASLDDHGCRVRRLSDGSLLPVAFAYPRVRPVVARAPAERV